jgi:D-sedoheptulose 7-phosphate isomerase
MQGSTERSNAMIGVLSITEAVQHRLQSRNALSRAFFAREATRLATACRRMAERFLRGGRLLAFGEGALATDAQHVSVEFVHPVIVGKRALPALDLSLVYGPWLDAICRPDDMVMGFGPPGGDPGIEIALAKAGARGAMTFALPGHAGDYAVQIDAPAFEHQELIEILYHTLWETVHVFFEHRELGLDTGPAGFLYPFLGTERQHTDTLEADVARSIVAKASDVERLREEVGQSEGQHIADAIVALEDRVQKGGKLILFGNGGSATDANDWAIDCVAPPPGYRSLPAISLSNESAAITAISNDVGNDLIFLRQLIAHAQPGDVAIAISTSGGSKSVVAALEEARKRGLLTVALLGCDGGEIRRRALADRCIVVRSDYIPRIQEVQASVYHVMRELMETGVNA